MASWWVAGWLALPCSPSREDLPVATWKRKNSKSSRQQSLAPTDVETLQNKITPRASCLYRGLVFGW